MGTSYTGVAANGARSPSISIMEPADGDPQAAATFNSAYSSLADFVAYLQAHFAGFDLAQTGAQAWTQANDFQGVAGDANPALQCTAVPTIRKLVLSAKLDSTGTPVYARVYAAGGGGGGAGGVEIVVGAAWSPGSSQWVPDAVAPYPTRLWIRPTSSGGNVVVSVYNGSSAFGDGAWTKNLTIDPQTVQSIDAQGVTGTGTMRCNVQGGLPANAVAAGGRVYVEAYFRKAYPSAPSSITFANATTVNVTNGGAQAGYSSIVTTAYGWHAYVIATGGTAETYAQAQFDFS